jgi:hypothetical protein
MEFLVFSRLKEINFEAVDHEIALLSPIAGG